MFLILIMLLVVGLVTVITYKAALEVNDAIQSADISDEAKVKSEELITVRMPLLFNYGFMFVLVMLWLAAIISAYLSDISPAFFIIGVLMIVIFVVVSGMMANVWASFADTSSVSTEAAQFSIMTWVFRNYITVAVVMGFSVLAVTFAKLRLR